MSIDIASGDIRQYAFNNVIGGKGLQQQREILALNDHEFWVLERDGSGAGRRSAGQDQADLVGQPGWRDQM